MKRRKKRTPKSPSNRQRVKEQAKELKELRHECSTDKIRINYLRATVLEKQQLINEQARTIESLKAEIRDLEVELTAKKPFWKRVLG
ncbi:hypothetical protein [Zhenhengia yiwuensis]|jgi:predicted  nucleic acid-binding Zn-ribbon protein|nr:hypothetical protein [Zhenhengia yiwuensis]MDY3367812.1 hypothetical protein [Zhenhengia yiwuensis]